MHLLHERGEPDYGVRQPCGSRDSGAELRDYHGLRCARVYHSRGAGEPEQGQGQERRRQHDRLATE